MWHMKAAAFQQALTTRKLKIKPKSANIAGLQLADLLVNPFRKSILIEQRMITPRLAPFAERIVQTAEGKLNRHLRSGRVEGYGKVFFPSQK